MAAVQKNTNQNAVMGTVMDNGRSRTAVVEARAFEEQRRRAELADIDEVTNRKRARLKELEKEQEDLRQRARKADEKTEAELERQRKEKELAAKRLKEELEVEYDRWAIQRAYDNEKITRTYTYKTFEERKQLAEEYYNEQKRQLDSFIALRTQKEAEAERTLASEKERIRQEVESQNPGASEEEILQRIAERTESRRQELFEEAGVVDLNRQISQFSASTSSARKEMDNITDIENSTLKGTKKWKKTQEDWQKKYENYQKLRTEAAKKQSAIDAKKAAGEAVTEAETAEAAQAAEASQAAGAEAAAGASGMVWAWVAEQAVNFINGSIKKFVGQLQEGINVYTEGVGKYNARMQGAGLTSTFLAASKMISTNLGLTGVASQKETVENLKKLADLGVAYNIEQRAFLQTISDEIAGTFDAFDSNLLRIIRLQQADTTASRMGMQADMVYMFNQLYQDTSYMNNAYNSVMSNLTEATSQMTRDQSIEFEYNVQKWLGSLSSLGISDQAITNIATGINYLASGNSAAIANNASLASLLGLSANRAGLDLGKLLTGGMTGETVNALLESMVKYLKEIAEGENNLVVKQAFGDVLGLSMSDFRAIYNMTESQMKTISNANMTYDKSRQVLTNRIGRLRFTIPISEQINTMMENISLGTAEGIANNPILLTTWMVNKQIEDATGGINIPSIMGNDINANLNQLASLAIAGMSQLANIPKLIGAIGSFIAPEVLGSDRRWLSSEFRNSRGAGFVGITAGSMADTSFSTQYVGSNSSSDVFASTLNEGVENSQEAINIMNQEEFTDPDAKELKDVYALLEEYHTDLIQRLEDLSVKVKYDPLSDFGGLL